jgi:hypothetical protein
VIPLDTDYRITNHFSFLEYVFPIRNEVFGYMQLGYHLFHIDCLKITVKLLKAENTNNTIFVRIFLAKFAHEEFVCNISTIIEEFCQPSKKYLSGDKLFCNIDINDAVEEISQLTLIDLDKNESLHLIIMIEDTIDYVRDCQARPYEDCEESTIELKYKVHYSSIVPDLFNGAPLRQFN